MILEPPKIKSLTVTTVFLSVCHEVMVKEETDRTGSYLESRPPSWARLWTLGCMPSIHGNDIPTGKPVALARWTFVGKVMSLLFNMLSRLVITFLPRSKIF